MQFCFHFVAIYAVLSRRHDLCKIRAFPGTFGVVPRHFQLLMMSADTCEQILVFKTPLNQNLNATLARAIGLGEICLVALDFTIKTRSLGIGPEI